MPNSPRVITAQDHLLICYQIEHEGKVLEGSLDEPPQRYQMGAGQWPQSIEQQMLGQVQGAHLQFEVKSGDNAFGEADPERIITMCQADFKHPPNLGELIEFTLPEGRQIEGQVMSIFNDNIEVDFNHPYAGRDLLIQIRVESIINA